jgi:hypothetical protein
VSERYRPTEDEAHAALAVARRRNRLNGGQTNLPGGETASEAERLMQHYTACLAEIAVSRIANRCWTGCGKGADGLYDVGNLYQVRSITQPGRGLLIRRKDLQNGNPPFVLVQVNADRECVLLGWLRPTEVLEIGRELDADSPSPCWIASQNQLREWPIS